ncbi:DUF262 domain-containing protein [Spirulina sp. CCNP1310]|uniref:DUF262 domain-containing protein n=1 Tax=Spirulina sp. CCNP1310 TaxID=3110249 RepID=UPI002B2196E7|nr:DUF262 domain-containing protein [Spirulina sp. CCNP1310]MEA5418958.1 DUF262 domain-containing protein [Spirulina sp. CCNP1310]
MISIETNTLEQEIAKVRNSLSADRLDMSFGELMSMYTSSELIIDPEFQRLFRWKIEQQTRFIESLLLGIPIPSVFVAENEEGKWEIVDGLQRLSTIFSFFGILKNYDQKNNWVMVEGGKVKSLKGLTLENLPLKFRLNIKRSVCRVEIVKWDSDYDMRYELFNRLNTGGSPLTDQEIRNCIFRGISKDFTELLKQLAEQEDFRELIQPTQRQEEELYLHELVLRFFSLFNNHHNVSDRLSEHMTQYMKSASQHQDDYVPKIEIFKRSICLVAQIGSELFKAKNNQFSSSLYDGILNGVAANLEYYESHGISELASRIEELKSDEKFKGFSGVAANYKKRTKGRIERALEVFAIHE